MDRQPGERTMVGALMVVTLAGDHLPSGAAAVVAAPHFFQHESTIGCFRTTLLVRPELSGTIPIIVVNEKPTGGRVSQYAA